MGEKANNDIGGISITQKAISLYRTLEEIEEIKKTIDICVKDGEETNTDFSVRKVLEPEFGLDKIKQQKTGNNLIDSLIPSKTGNGKGKVDIFVFNTFGNGLVDIIIEDKSPKDKTKDPLGEAIYYANEINKGLDDKIRIVIGYNPASNNDIQLRVLVEDTWRELIIDGKKVNSLIGKELVRVIYENPDQSIFEFKDVRNFTQKDFINILNQLRTLYRGLPDLATNDKSKIDITISFIALKMILEKEMVKAHKVRYFWNRIKTREDIKNSVDAILNDDVLSKYKTIFHITNTKKGNKQEVEFDFINKITSFEEPKLDTDIDKVIQIYEIINKLPQLHSLNIDLFGETYEILANKKTKSEFGEFFTRRHIIKSLLDIFYTTTDINNILKNYNGEEEIKICDTSCGTGGFLTESFKLIAAYYNRNKGNYKNPINLSRMAQKVVCGLDINGTNITRTQINMYLAGDGFSEIKQQDTLKLDGKELYDYVVTNVPYGKGETLVDKTITKNKRLEVNFVIKIIQLLKHNGKALIIVPDGLLEAPSLAPIREWMLKQCKLKTVISLPKFAFAPYTKEKTYAIILEKRNESLTNLLDIENEKYWTYIIDNDGFANSDKKFETSLKEANGQFKHNELTDWTEIKADGTIKNHKSIMVECNGKEHDPLTQPVFNEWDKIIEGKKYGYITMSKVLSNVIENPKKLSDVEIRNMIAKSENSDFFSPLLVKNKIDIKKLKEQYYDGDEQVEDNEFVEPLMDLGITYSYEEDCFFSEDTETTYLLNLIPEKYFRQKTIQEISLQDLASKRIEIEKAIQKLSENHLDDEFIANVATIHSRIEELSKYILTIQGEEYKIKNLCHVSRGVVINDKQLYENKGDIPVYTSQTLNDGLFGTVSLDYFKSLTKGIGKPNTLTWTTDGSYAGTIFKRNTEFVYSNVCGMLEIKDNTLINIDFLKIILTNTAKSYVGSNGNNQKLMKSTMENIKIIVPPLAVQNQVVDEYNKLNKLKRNLAIVLTI